MKCPECGNEFVPKHEAQRLCSLACVRHAGTKAYVKRHRIRHECICRHCGQAFTPKATDRTTYCSRECAFAERRKISAEREVNEVCCVAYCRICGKATLGRNRYCSNECRRKKESQRARQLAESRHHAEPTRCAWCGETFTPQYGDKKRVYCSKGCCEKAGKANRSPQRRIARRKQLKRRRYQTAKRGEAITMLHLYERDAGRCQLCGRRVNLNYKFPDMRSASTDHIVPVSKGGTHEWWNVQLAHLGCNATKRDTVWNNGEQLRLGAGPIPITQTA